MRDETKNRRHTNKGTYWVKKAGLLYARLQYTDEFGVRRDKYRRIEKKSDARTVVEKMRSEIEQGGSELLHADRMTFDQLANEFERIKVVPAVYSNGLKVAGRRSLAPVKSQLKYLRKYFGKKPIRAIKTIELEEYKLHRLGTPVITKVNEFRKVYNPKTKRTKTIKVKVPRESSRNIGGVNREMQLLKAIFNFAVENDWLIKNPFKRKGIISVSAETKRDRVLSYEEEERLLKACTGKREHLRPILICALDTGMRRGEMLQMKWQDVDFKENKIHIPQSNTKTETARTVGITARLKEELNELRASGNVSEMDNVFAVTCDVKNAWKAALREAQIENFRLHDCRHTATTRMIASGSPHTEVMKITGHSQMVTFLRYLNVTPETIRGVAGRLDTYLIERQPIIEETVSEYLN